MTTRILEKTEIVGVESAKFLKAMTLRFTVTNCKPNTRMYPLFDGIRVDDYCVGLDGSPNLTTDSVGNLTGFFQIPALTFTSGPKVFRVQDVNTDVSLLPLNSNYGYAENVLNSFGVISTKQKTTTQITTNIVNREIYI